MGIRRYPRPGQKISPDTLAPVLGVPIPWRLQNTTDLEGKLADLDETVWDRLSPNVCAKLGAAVVREISSRIASLPPDILAKKLPLPDPWPSVDSNIEDLPLEARTYNCLVAEGLMTPAALRELTIADLLNIRSFGAKSLVDLLATLESLEFEGPAGTPEIEPPVIGAIDPHVQRWPRPGQRLAPKALEEILGEPIPAPVRRRHSLDVDTLSQLDEHVWETLDTPAIAKLGELVVQAVDAQLPSLPPNIIHMVLPMPESGAELQSIEVERRTYNCLKREGLLVSPERLYGMSIGEFLQLRGIGGKGLIDLLTALEHCTPTVVSDEAVDPDADREARALADKISEQLAGGDVSRDDPRFGTLLRAVDPTAAQLSDVVNSIRSGSVDPTRLRTMARPLGALFERIRASERLSLRDEFIEVATVGLGERDRAIVGHYLGWEGDGPRTLKQIGEQFGLTRERVRQIGVEQTEWVKRTKPHVPTFRRTIDALSEALPLDDGGLRQLLAGGGLDDSDLLSLRAIEHGANLFSIDLPFAIAEVHSQSLAVACEDSNVLSTVARHARRLSESWGLIGRAELDALVETEIRRRIDPSTVDLVASTLPGVRPLGDSGDWLAVLDGLDNRLVAQLARVVERCPEIDLRELRTALVRTYRRGETGPPTDAFRSLCEQVDFVTIVGDRVTKVGSIEAPTTGNSERTILEIIEKNGGAISVAQLEGELARLGMKRATTLSRIDHSPLFYWSTDGQIAICGSGAPRGPVPRATSIDRLRVRLDADALESGVVQIGALGSDRLPEGPCRVRAGDGVLVGSGERRGAELRGLGPLFDRRGGEPNDWVEIDASGTREITVRLLSN